MIMAKQKKDAGKGQGLVEYALILVMVSVVVMAVLTLLGPQVGNVFSTVIAGLGGTTNSAPAAAPGGGATITSAQFHLRGGNNVVLRVETSEPTTITLTDSQGGALSSVLCNNACAPNITVGGGGSGTITVSAPGNSVSVFYPEP